MPAKSATKGFVYLIGAGPGDPGLITVKGRDCLAKAQVVMYDYLANDELLRLAPKGAELIYDGKVGRVGTLKRDRISECYFPAGGCPLGVDLFSQCGGIRFGEKTPQRNFDKRWIAQELGPVCVGPPKGLHHPVYGRGGLMA